MRKIIGAIIMLVLICATGFKCGVLKENHISPKVYEETLRLKPLYKGLQGACDVTMDGEGNYYIAYENRIQKIDKNGQGSLLFKDESLDISSIEYDNNKLYVASGTKVFSYDINEKSRDIIIKEIPNFGDYHNSIIKIYDEYLFVTIGAATNSAIVGPDNSWVENYPYAYDMSPKPLTIKGLSFGKEKTGAFVPYKTKNNKGQILTEHFPGNASIIVYNIKTEGKETYAWGIRNITGLDLNSQGKIIASIGGMEDRGLRPIKGDSDYIYQIIKGKWYGWPDYTGGDPVTSPRFIGGKNQSPKFILDKHPTSNPPAPIYQHKSVSSIGKLSVDKSGILGKKDCIYFYDSKDNIIYGFNKSILVSSKVKFYNNENIKSLKIFQEGMIILDSEQGYLYCLEKNKEENKLFIIKDLMIYILITTFMFIVYLVIKLYKSIGNSSK